MSFPPAFRWPGVILPRFFLTAPNQHRPLCDLREEAANSALSPLPGGLFPHPLQNRVPRVQVLLPLPKNRRKHWVFAGFLFACVARLCGSRWFKVRLFAPGFIRSQPFPSPPPPKTHPASPFRALPGALRSFYPLLIREIPRIFALSLALEMIQDSVEHLNSGFRSRGGNRGKLRFFCRVAQMGHPFFPCRFWEPREYYA